jgi:hypothetical protein
MAKVSKEGEKEMKNINIMVRVLISVMAMIGLATLPVAVSADDANKINTDYYWYNLSIDELGAGATPLAGMTVAEYRARQKIVQSSPISLDINLNPIK